MARISGVETKFARTIKGVIPSLVATGLFLTSWSNLCAEAGAGVIQTRVHGPPPDTLQIGLEDMLHRLKLTHVQREQVEQIMAGEALQLKWPVGIPSSR